MEITKLFLITYFAAFIGVVPPGLVNMSVAKTCVQQGKRNGMLMAIGACVVVFIQALIAVLMAKYIFSHPQVRNALLRTGVVIFIVLAVYFFIAAKKSKVKKVRTVTNAGLRSVGKGAFVAAINILPIPYFCAIAAALNVGAQVSYDIVSIILFLLGASLGTFTALYLYVVGFNHIQKKARSLTRYTNYFMAALMVVLVIITVIRMYYVEE